MRERDLFGRARSRVTKILFHNKRFCRTVSTTPWPADMVIVEDFTTKLIYSGFCATAVNAWSGIQHEMKVRGFGFLCKSQVLKMLHRKALKLNANSGQALRDQMTAEAIRHFCGSSDPL